MKIIRITMTIWFAIFSVFGNRSFAEFDENDIISNDFDTEILDEIDNSGDETISNENLAGNDSDLLELEKDIISDDLFNMENLENDIEQEDLLDDVDEIEKSDLYNEVLDINSDISSNMSSNTSSDINSDTNSDISSDKDSEINHKIVEVESEEKISLIENENLIQNIDSIQTLNVLNTSLYSQIGDELFIAPISLGSIENVLNNEQAVPNLIISEVYWLGSNERIEITNISDTDFSGNIALSGAKSGLYSIKGINIPSYKSIIIADNQNVGIVDDSVVKISDAGLNINDGNEMNIELLFSGNVIDSFIVDGSDVTKNKTKSPRPSFQKIYDEGREIEISTPLESYNLSGFVGNPGVIIIRSDSTPWIGDGPSENFNPGESEGEKDSDFSLILSEVFYDDDDEWIEIFNIGDGFFLGDIVLSGNIFVEDKTNQIYDNVQIPANDFLIIADSSDMFDFSSTNSGTVNILINSGNLSQFSILDDDSISIDLLLSGDIVDSFYADKYWVEKRDDYGVSFHKIVQTNGSIISRAMTNDIANISDSSRNYANPGVLYTSADNIIDYSTSPQAEDDENDVICDDVKENLITISEIFRGGNRYDPYIEFDIHEDLEYEYDSIELSGSILEQNISIDLNEETETYDQEKLQKNTKLILTTKAGELTEAGLITIVLHPNLKFKNFTGELELYGIEGQSRQLLDIVKISSGSLEKSVYRGGSRYTCGDEMDNVMDFSPGFDESALKYFSVTSSRNEKIVETVKYVGGGGGCSCPSKKDLCGETTTGFINNSGNAITGMVNDLTGDALLGNILTGNELTGGIKIINLSYKTPESITLQSFFGYDVDFSKHLYYLKTSTSNSKKYIEGILSSYSVDIFTKNFGFVDSGACVYLYSGDTILDNYCYSGEKKEKTTKDKEEKEDKSENFNPGDYQLSISYIDYDPEGSDTGKEKITIESESEKSLDLSKIKLKINSTNKNLSGILNPYSSITLEGTFGFPNSTKDGSSVKVSLFTGDYVFTTYEYNPNKKIEALTGEKSELTGDILELTGENNEKIVQSIPNVKIQSILPNPSGKDSDKEEISLLRIPASGLIENMNLNPDFTLLINSKTKKSLQGQLLPNQTITIKGSFGFPNSASCVSLLYSGIKIDTFCYGKAGDGVKFTSDNTSIREIPTDELDIIKKISLVKQGDKLCISYNKELFSCKSIPNSTTEKNSKLLSMQNNYIQELKKYLKSDFSMLYYNSKLKEYFDLYDLAKKSIKSGNYSIKYNGIDIKINEIDSVFSNLYEQDVQSYFVNSLYDLLPNSINSALLQMSDKYSALQAKKADLGFISHD